MRGNNTCVDGYQAATLRRPQCTCTQFRACIHCIMISVDRRHPACVPSCNFLFIKEKLTMMSMIRKKPN